jgi:hypothetical protein
VVRRRDYTTIENTLNGSACPHCALALEGMWREPVAEQRALEPAGAADAGEAFCRTSV